MMIWNTVQTFHRAPCVTICAAQLSALWGFLQQLLVLVWSGRKRLIIVKAVDGVKINVLVCLSTRGDLGRNCFVFVWLNCLNTEIRTQMLIFNWGLCCLTIPEDFFQQGVRPLLGLSCTELIVNSVYQWIKGVSSVGASPAVARRSRRYKTCEATQQELMKETLCDERAACSISKHQCEDTSCVPRERDVPLRLSDLWKFKLYC